MKMNHYGVPPRGTDKKRPSADFPEGKDIPYAGEADTAIFHDSFFMIHCISRIHG